MAISPSQINGPREAFEAPKSPDLRLIHGGKQIREQIGKIADRSLEKGLISKETYDGYKAVAAGTNEFEMNMKVLESTRDFASGHEGTVFRIHEKIQAARVTKIASEGDEHFLMEQIKLKVKDFEFDQKAEWYEKRIDEKLAHMKRDKNQYMELAGHKLIKGIGYLKVDGNTRIELPNEEGFLKLTVLQRRELLKKLEEALPKAEVYAKEHESKEDKELTDGYKKKLDGARKKGIIGEHTYNEFWNSFKKIDHEEKKYWIGEFDAQMERYEILWGQIRGSLEGKALKSIESKIDDSGYTELFSEFGKLKRSESERLGKGYTQELEKYREEGIIGRHTMSQFALWMGQQELSDQYKAEKELPEQMLRYEELWQNVEDLSGKQQDFMRSKIDIYGYTELNQQYLAFKGGAEVPQAEVADSDPDSLSQLESKEVRNAIIETDEMLAGQGKSKRSNFIEILDKMFRKVGRDKFDANSFQIQIRGEAANDNGVERTAKGREANDEVDLHQIKKDTKILEEKGGAKVTEDRGFVQVESKEGDKTARKAQVTINEEDGMKRFFTEDGKHNYRAKEEGGHDDLSLAIKTDSGRTVELDLQEIQALQKHLEKSEKEERLDKAT